MLERPFDFWDSWPITLNLTVLDKGLILNRYEHTKPALANRNNISLLHVEARRTMSGNVAMSLLVTTAQNRHERLPSVLLDITQVITAHNNSTLHLGGNDQSLQNRSTNSHIRGERTLLIDILSVNSSSRGLNSQANVSIPTLVSLLAKKMDLTIREFILLLECSLIL